MKKILILSANPKDTDKLRLDKEAREIEIALERAKNRDKFNIVSKWAVRIDDLRRTLLDYKPNIVHFCGHGAGIEGLALEDNYGRTQLVSSDALASIFELFRGTVKCVLLNACYSEVQAQAIHQHVDYVIGMNQPIGDVAAIEFATGFYDALGAGEGYDYAFRMGCASIRLKGSQEYSTPVLKFRPSSPSISTTKTEQDSEEKPQISNQLSKDLDVTTQSTEPSRKQNQINNLSGINAGSNFNYAPVQASGNVTSWSTFNETKKE
ncbi:MAG: CHAT domain-containing protein, partial [Tolypothrix sp. T3-bin4]|nr:CHAT domain-containing protein [Tolypothrix sp. T3-bin4]